MASRPLFRRFFHFGTIRARPGVFAAGSSSRSQAQGEGARFRKQARGLCPPHRSPSWGRRPQPRPPPFPQTELVDGEEHDHAVTSRISLVDLAGSERQGPAGTSGQLLRVRGRGLLPGAGLHA